jgi:ribosomal protein S17
VTRVGLSLGYVAPEARTENRRMVGLDQVLQKSVERGERLVALCDKRSVAALGDAMLARGWSTRPLADRLKWTVVELLPPPGR